MKTPSEPQLEALAKQLKSLSSIEPTVADGSITNAKLAKNSVKSDNIDWTTIPCFVSHKGYSDSDTIDFGYSDVWEHLDIHKYFPTIDVDKGNLVDSDGLNIVLKDGIWDIRAMIYGQFNEEKPDVGALLFVMLTGSGETLDHSADDVRYYRKRLELASTVKGPVNVQLFLGNYLSEEDIFHLRMSRLSVHRVG